MANRSQKIKIPLHMSDKGREVRRQERAKAEEVTRMKVGEWWDAHDKAVESSITRGDYKDLVEFVEPDSKPLADETMDELIAQCDGGLVRKEEAVRVIVKARSFLRTHKEMEEIFEQVAQQAGVGHPTKALVMPMMVKLLAPYSNMPELNDDDVSEVWDLCDTNGDGRIARPELLLALATWRDNLVRIYSKQEGQGGSASSADASAKKSEGSSMCVLL